MTNTVNVRIGARMREAIDYVSRHPGCTKLAAARAVGPHGSLKFGYAIVDRAIAAGKIRAENLGGRYALYAG